MTAGRVHATSMSQWMGPVAKPRHRVKAIVNAPTP